MKFPHVTALDWRAQVEKELAGASFDKVLVNRTAEGLAIQPLYSEAPAVETLADARSTPFRICMRHTTPDVEALKADLDGGADAVWVSLSALDRIDAGTFVVLDAPPGAALDRLAGRSAAITGDPLGALARGEITADALAPSLHALTEGAVRAVKELPDVSVAMVSTLPYHDAGADGADEIAIGLATGVVYLEALLAAGLAPNAAATQIALRVAVGRDTFAELCKVRALRIGWQKVLAAAGVTDAPRARVHAVCSSRTLTQRDPWVNMLRVTTQVFAGVLGGADLVTPAAFDEASGPASLLGQRIARNTGLVLREERFLGKVIDPAGGAYYLEALTDALARAAWRRFQAITREGGVESALVSGRLRAQLDAK